MSVPNTVKQLLETQNIAYAVSSAHHETEPAGHEQHLRDTGAAKSIILQDQQGRVQVLIPANCLLDLNAVNQELNRNLTAVQQTDLRMFFDKHKLQSIPALPKLTGLPSVVDHRLLKPDHLLLDAGVSYHLIEIRQTDFQQILADAVVCDIAVPLTALESHTDSEKDSADIAFAVQNFTTLRIRQRLEETLDLPPLPETAQRIIALRVDPNADINDLAAIVETDPSLAAQVISWAASPYYSAPGSIRSIHDAIVRVLGFDMVLNLALGLALGRTLKVPKENQKHITTYWQQAVCTAAAIEALVSAIPREYRPRFGMAYLSGLLHNFGYLILAEVFPPYFKNICHVMEANTHVSHDMVEKHILGINREQLAGWLMGLWNMPEIVVTALRQQNNLNYAGKHHEYAKLLLVSNRLLRQKGIGTGPALDIPDITYQQLHLTPEDAAEAIDKMTEHTEDLNHLASQLSNE